MNVRSRLLFRMIGPAILAALMVACRTAAQGDTPVATASVRLVNAMPEFWRVMDETSGRDDATWLAAYRARIVAPHRELYSLARGGLDDSSLVRYRRAILTDAAAYRALSDSLPPRLSATWTRFVRALPDARPGTVVYILPAPASAIGGWLRPLPDHDAVVYGFSLLASANSDADFGVRVNHELAHAYHVQVNPQMRSMVTTFFMNRGDHRTALYELMWVEGFAAYASQRLTAGAERHHIISPRVTQANDAVRAQTARAFRERMDVTDRATVEAFVYGGTDAVPAQAVNYIGVMIAERLAARSSLSEMARLQGPSLHEAIRRELEAIEAGRSPGASDR